MADTLPTTSDLDDGGLERTPRFGTEVLLVLGVGLGLSGLTSALGFLRTELTVPGGIAATTATAVQVTPTSYPILDFLDALADVLRGFMPAFLALYLLWRSPGRPGFGIGLDRLRLGGDAARAVGLTALIGLPGLGLVWSAHVLGLNASLGIVDVPDQWYRIPLLLLQALESGTGEEIVVLAFMLTRLAALGWSRERALIASATVRGSYHLYQGIGGFLGNAVMGLIFGWLFQRSRRVLPMLIAHFLLDAISFIGYVYLHDRLSWI